MKKEARKLGSGEAEKKKKMPTDYTEGHRLMEVICEV
jgi:hypothetical protein